MLQRFGVFIVSYFLTARIGVGEPRTHSAGGCSFFSCAISSWSPTCVRVR
jgi:hypothetical protein